MKRLNPYRVQGRAVAHKEIYVLGAPPELESNLKPRQIITLDRIRLMSCRQNKNLRETTGFYFLPGAVIYPQRYAWA